MKEVAHDPRLETDLAKQALERVKDFPAAVEAVKKLCYTAAGDGLDSIQAVHNLEMIVSIDDETLMRETKALAGDNEIRVDSVYYDDFFENPSIYWALVVQNNRAAYVPFEAEAIEKKVSRLNLSTDEGYQELCDVCLSCLKEKGFNISALPKIEDASPALQYVFNDFWSSENDNYFIEQDDGSWDVIGISKEEFIRQIDQDIEKFNLQEAIVADSDDALYSVYPDLLAAFSTKNEEQSRSVELEKGNKKNPSKEKAPAVR